MLTCRLHAGRRAQLGMTIVELMVGVAIGLIIVAAASLLMTNQVVENRRLLTHDAQEIPKWIPLLGVGGTNDDGQQVEEPVSWLGHGQAPSHSDNKTVPATACGR